VRCGRDMEEIPPRSSPRVPPTPEVGHQAQEVSFRSGAGGKRRAHLLTELADFSVPSNVCPLSASTGARGMPVGKALRCRSAIAIVLAALSASLAQLPGQQANGGAESISPLIQALVDDNVTLANLLLDAGADVAVLDTITPLYAAQEYVSKRKARHAMLRRLLAAGSPVDQTTQDGTTTLMLAAYHGDAR
jgi:hypothetical protein